MKKARAELRAELLDAYTKAGQSAEAARLVQEQLADARRTFAKESPQLAGALAQYSLTLRVEIDHRPGMLGKVASAIGDAGEARW